ncbi:hypothetical protein SAMN05421505_109202 [Sinosporangium album]|uniref:Uncharacterized protein n=1 Tax=Sinosporangium album TaxID=504805 RepID=A0A1G7YDB8_9ACTN|nr:hypothetical protein [Sinosporangium album]SDG94335.1 hypothetical protein SAMN05421505_109202 [Sinosporangium album]
MSHRAEQPHADVLQVDRERVKTLARDIGEQARPPIERAYTQLLGLQVAEATPTAFTRSLAVVYMEAEGYMLQRVRRRVQRIEQAGVRLHDNRDNWQWAEVSSTLDPATWNQDPRV